MKFFIFLFCFSIRNPSTHRTVLSEACSRIQRVSAYIHIYQNCKTLVCIRIQINKFTFEFFQYIYKYIVHFPLFICYLIKHKLICSAATPQAASPSVRCDYCALQPLRPEFLQICRRLHRPIRLILVFHQLPCLLLLFPSLLLQAL